MAVDHVTNSDVGQLCNGEPCAICNTCSACGRVLPYTAHVLVCTCPETQEHEVCDACLPLLDAGVDWSDGDPGALTF